MSLFDLPDIERLRQENDIKGLIDALSYQDDIRIQKAAATALIDVGATAVESLIVVFRNRNTVVHGAAKDVLVEIGEPAV